jgi:DNA-directed RNA polymerase specialized sigma24 family protein
MSATPELAPPADPDRWVEDHGDCLYSYALIRVRNREVAEDLVQETLLAAMREMDNLPSKEVCEILNISEANLWVMLHRAHMALWEDLEMSFFGGKGTTKL